MMLFSSFFALLLGCVLQSQAITVDFSNKDSIKSAMSTMAYDMMTSYSGNETGGTPGLLPGPCASSACYYWWEAGAMLGSLINYWQYTGDNSYNPTVSQAMLFQVGPDKNYNPPNQSKDMGLDDQVFWAFSAMDAVEAGFPNPPSDQPQWLALAQAVFNFQATLWDSSSCGGGFRWQVYSFNTGYNLKTTISNGGFFQLAARLARYTGNATYSDWADKTWDWMASSPLFQTSGNEYQIWDNTDSKNNCSNAEHASWTYNVATLIMGSAYMYNYTNGGSVWEDRLNKLLAGATVYFPQEYGGSILSEVACEKVATCDSDQTSFKAYMSRWLGVTSQIAPFTAQGITPKLQASAKGAAGQCDGGENGRMCGRRWYTSTWDGSSGVGQQMCALSVLGASLISDVQAPLTPKTGGNSTGNPDAGTGPPTDPTTGASFPVRMGDKVGAAILTIVVIAGLSGLTFFIISD